MPREPLVMIPPLLSDARVFAHQIQVLSRTHPVLVAPPSRYDRMEDIAYEILSWAPASFALLGMGFGGMVAMELLRCAPGRITYLALVSTSPQADTPQIAAGREPHIIAAMAGRIDDVLQHEINSTWMAPTTDKSALVHLLRQMGQDIGAEVYARQARALQRRKDQQALLHKMQLPTTVIGGAHDGQYNLKRHQFMADLIPYARLEVIEKAGYLPTLEAPSETTAAIMGWLQQPLVLRG